MNARGINMIFEKVLSTINKYNLIENGDKVVLGISGGPDSVCLLHILYRLKEVMNIDFVYPWIYLGGSTCRCYSI